MAKAKTGSFILTEKVSLTDNAVTQATIDLGSYVDIGSRTGLAIESVDFTVQGYTTADGTIDDFAAVWGSDARVQIQLFDQSETVLKANDDRNLIASGYLIYDNSGGLYQASDVYPDNFGKLSDARMVINDTLYLIAGNLQTAFTSGKGAYVTVRIKAKLVKLDTKDWMAIAIQSTASDN